MARLFSTPRRLALALAAGLVLFSVLAVAKDAIPVGELSVGQIEDELQVNMKLSPYPGRAHIDMWNAIALTICFSIIY